MATILIPGRHLITSKFMVDYLQDLCAHGVGAAKKLGVWHGEDSVTRIVIPITSANQHGSRYNPVPLYARIIGLERTLEPMRRQYGIQISFVPIPHFRVNDHFAELTIKYVNAILTNGVHPESALVWTSTKPLMDAYQALGYAVLPAEWDLERGDYAHEPPQKILSALAKANETYTRTPAYSLLSTATQSVWKDMPEVPEHIFRLWHDPLLTEDGSLTEERNYATYAVGMSHSALMNIKFNDIKGGVVEGKIADEGCADGALMVRLAEAFPDSDIIGIDITGEFISRVEERQRAGEFGDSFVHVYQRNLLQPIFAPESIDTVICNSTLHEIWSYGNQEASVRGYLKEKYRQLSYGGRLVIRDVVGPEDKNDEVYVRLADDDGENIDPMDTSNLLAASTEALSTYTRFFRFAHDFLKDLRVTGRRGEDTVLRYDVETIDGIRYIKTRMKNIVEFLSRKDYHDNWDSEMNEEFAFWDVEEWKRTLESYGFKIVHDSATLPRFSQAYTNEWIIEKRWRSCVTIYKKNTEELLLEQPYPVTNMVLVAEKQMT